MQDNEKFDDYWNRVYEPIKTEFQTFKSRQNVEVLKANIKRWKNRFRRVVKTQKKKASAKWELKRINLAGGLENYGGWYHPTEETKFGRGLTLKDLGLTGYESSIRIQNLDPKTKVACRELLGDNYYIVSIDPGPEMVVYSPAEAIEYSFNAGFFKKANQAYEKRRKRHQSKADSDDTSEEEKKLHRLFQKEAYARFRGKRDASYKSLARFLTAFHVVSVGDLAASGDFGTKYTNGLVRKVVPERLRLFLDRHHTSPFGHATSDGRVNNFQCALRAGEKCTTMSCGHCGLPNFDIGRSKLFICPHCGCNESRDGGAARKILIKLLFANEQDKEERDQIVSHMQNRSQQLGRWRELKQTQTNSTHGSRSL